MTSYNPSNRADRQYLATRIIAELDSLGFTLDRARPPGEKVYTREREPGVTVLVYTSIIGGEVRALGKDAIRVSTIYTGKPRTRPLGTETTIHRRGTIDSIAGRLVERARHALEVELPRCGRCRGPAFVSKAGKPTCAAICWERHLTPVASPAVERAPAQPAVVETPRRHEPRLTTLRPRRGGRASAVDW